MALLDTIRGEISPKSVEASGDGLFIAQNMMYRHSVTVYNRSRELVATVPDQVDLGALGGPPGAGLARGAPVEAAFAPGGRYAYVSNYSMYGPGFGAEGTDTCSPSSPIEGSFLYRLDTASLRFDRVAEVGQVPKYVAATPDGSTVLVSNWCSYDLSVVDTSEFRELRRVELGAYPRGIVVTPDSSTAYVAVMGSTRIAVVDLASFAVSWITGVGSGPRHLVLSPDGRLLYATLNGDGRVVKIDTATRRVVGRISTGAAPRSMTIAEDGGALYVVNNASNTVAKVRTDDMTVVQTVDTAAQPIGIAYDVHDRVARVWVACYSGSIMVFDDV